MNPAPAVYYAMSEESRREVLQRYRSRRQARSEPAAAAVRPETKNKSDEMSTTCLSPTWQPTPPYRDGAELRALDPGDEAAVLEVFAGLGPRSRELRFLTPKPRLSSADLHQLTAVDHHDHVAILAVSATSGSPDRHRPVRPRPGDVRTPPMSPWRSSTPGRPVASAPSSSPL